jgi:hypothetical protein
LTKNGLGYISVIFFANSLGHLVNDPRFNSSSLVLSFRHDVTNFKWLPLSRISGMCRPYRGLNEDNSDNSVKWHVLHNQRIRNFRYLHGLPDVIFYDQKCQFT